MAKITSAQLWNMLNPFEPYYNKDRKDGMYEYVPSKIRPDDFNPAKELFKKLNGRDARTFLDLGCGKGGALYSALDAGLIPTGVEISSELIKLAKQIRDLGIIPNSDRLTFIKGDILKWVPDKQYDIVYFYHPLQGEKLHLQFLTHVHKVFPVDQLFVILGGTSGHSGFKPISVKNNFRDSLHISVPVPDDITKINGLSVVAKIDTAYIFGYNGKFYKSSDIKVDNRNQATAHKAEVVNFKLFME